MRSFLILASLLAACQSDNVGEHAWSACDQEETVMGLDEVSDLGFSGQDMLDLAEGTHQETLLYIPDSSTSPLEITVTYTGGDVIFVDQEPAEWDGDGAEPALGAACDDYMLVPVTFTFQTEDGMFDESLELDLGARDAGEVTTFARIDPEDLAGDYTFTELDPSEYQDLVYFLDATFDEGGTSGTIDAQASGEDTDCTGDDCIAWAQNLELAAWPAEALD